MRSSFLWRGVKIERQHLEQNSCWGNRNLAHKLFANVGLKIIIVRKIQKSQEVTKLHSMLGVHQFQINKNKKLPFPNN